MSASRDAMLFAMYFFCAQATWQEHQTAGRVVVASLQAIPLKDAHHAVCRCVPIATQQRGPIAGFAVLCIAGACTWCTFGPAWSWPAEIFHGPARASGIALFNTFGSCGEFDLCTCPRLYTLLAGLGLGPAKVLGYAASCILCVGQSSLEILSVILASMSKAM
jgi:hypothetical protein